MATSRLKWGNVIPWTNGTGSGGSTKLSGSIQATLERAGVLTVDTVDGGVGEIDVTGVHVLTAKAHETTEAIKAGQKVYWDPVNARVDKTVASGLIYIGHAEVAKASAATTCKVRLDKFTGEGNRVLTIAATGATTLSLYDFSSGGLLLVLAPNTAAATLNLPTVLDVPVGALLRVRKTTADAAAVTIDPAGSETIAGSATHATIDADKDTALFINTGAAWILVDSEIA